MSNLEFAWPYAAIALFLLVPMWYLEKSSGQVFTFLTSSQAVVVKNLVDKTSSRFMLRGFFTGLVWVLLTLALMRPQFVGEPIEITKDGRNLMMVLDISESMDAEDMSMMGEYVSRLVASKKVMHDFIDRRHGDRIGLIVFGSEPFLHAPLSFDYPTIKQFLTDAQTGFAGPKTAIGDAIGLSVKKLLDQASGERTVILLTDGQNNAGHLLPIKAAQIAKEHGIKIYIVGLGSSRMVVDGFFGKTAVNPSASLDEAEPELTNIASLTGGKYFRARDVNTLKSIYNEIDQIEPVKSDPLVIIPKKELFYWPLGLLVGIWLFQFGQIFFASFEKTIRKFRFLS